VAAKIAHVQEPFVDQESSLLLPHSEPSGEKWIRAGSSHLMIRSKGAGKVGRRQSPWGWFQKKKKLRGSEKGQRSKRELCDHQLNTSTGRRNSRPSKGNAHLSFRTTLRLCRKLRGGGVEGGPRSQKLTSLGAGPKVAATKGNRMIPSQ